MSVVEASEGAANRRVPMLADLCGGRDNNLNLIRMIAASMVLVSHAFPVTIGRGAIEPLQALTGHSLGWLSVAVFFVISGFLIARSYDRRVTGWHWLTARVLRLFPGLFVVLVLTLLILGPLVTTLDARAYWTAAWTWTYVPVNLLLYPQQYGLPGVFADNPYPLAINGSLWTLKHEVTCYGGVFLAGVLGMLRKPKLFGGGMLVVALLYVLIVPFDYLRLTGQMLPLFELVLPFSLGMCAYVWRDHIPLDWWLVALVWVVAIAAKWTPVFTPFYLLAIAYTTLVLAYRPKGALLHYNRLGDYSYGIYVYAFPLQQLAAHLSPGQHWATNIALTFPATLLCAILSWHLVEKRSLAFAKPAAERWVAFWRREGAGIAPKTHENA